MNNTLTYKAKTFIANLSIDQSSKDLLIAHLSGMNDTDLATLLITFKKYPQSVPLYIEYIKDLKEKSLQFDPEKLEQLLSTLA